MVTTHPNAELGQAIHNGTASLFVSRPLSQNVQPAREVNQVGEGKSKPEGSFFSALLRSLSAFAV
jgi:hypothetical protein